MNRLAYIYLEAYEDEEGQIHYMSKAEGNSVDLTLLIAYLYHDQKEIVDSAIQQEVQDSIKDNGQEFSINWGENNVTDFSKTNSN